MLHYSSVRKQAILTKYGLFFFMALLFCSPASAADIELEDIKPGEGTGVSIAPTRININDRERIQTFTVINRSSSPSLINVQALSWTQDEQGKNIHRLTRDVIVNPPIAKIPGNEQQEFRVGLRRANHETDELVYRIHVGQTPQEEYEEKGPKMVLGFLLPVFVSPSSPKKPSSQVSWTVLPSDDKYQIVLMGKNTGNAHFRAQILMPLFEGEHLGIKKAVQYILPGHQRIFHITRIGDPESPGEIRFNTPDQILILNEGTTPIISDIQASASTTIKP